MTPSSLLSRPGSQLLHHSLVSPTKTAARNLVTKRARIVAELEAGFAECVAIDKDDTGFIISLLLLLVLFPSTALLPKFSFILRTHS